MTYEQKERKRETERTREEREKRGEKREERNKKERRCMRSSKLVNVCVCESVLCPELLVKECTIIKSKVKLPSIT